MIKRQQQEVEDVVRPRGSRSSTRITITFGIAGVSILGGRRCPRRSNSSFDTADPDREARFWAAALGYQLQPPPDGFDTWASFLQHQGIPEERWNDASAVVDPDGKGPRIFFQRVPEGKIAKNRMHMDLNASGGRSTALEERTRGVDAEVARLTTLGATDERGAIERDGEYWVRMNDPEGNEFCVQ